jgi:hypothetical protein
MEEIKLEICSISKVALPLYCSTLPGLDSAQFMIEAYQHVV